MAKGNLFAQPRNCGTVMMGNLPSGGNRGRSASRTGKRQYLPGQWKEYQLAAGTNALKWYNHSSTRGAGTHYARYNISQSLVEPGMPRPPIPAKYEHEWAYKVGYMSTVVDEYHGLVWKEIPGTIISRNSRRYGQSFGAIILIPGMVTADDLPRYSQPDTLGLLSYVYPIR